MKERGSRTYVYVLPNLGEDLIKVGLTQDPFERFRAFHPRFYAYFDLEQGLLIETRQLREARRVERLFIERWSEHRATAPTIVHETAGGHTEWFRGIETLVPEFAARIAERYGYTLHTPLKAWLGGRLFEHADTLYQWSSTVLDDIQQKALYEPGVRDQRLESMLRNMLDMYAAMDFQIEPLVPVSVFTWYTTR
ncbi:GIY-YIG nuclease family protein [Dyella dinghuensis]|uniref:GIY-YIG nuclease family protein n=1 Tax=Dyella dinghuensis TaxID=1920169 RepID=UPI001315A650|nr:GIY-YIG nuclease family protein [Dyella dinghuensis]